MSEYDLEAIVAQKAEAVGGEEVTFTYGGETFSMPHPLFADDDWKEGLSEVQGDVEFGEYVLGEDYERFRAAGGRAGFLSILMDRLHREAQAEDRDGRPTRSSTSSRAQKRRQKRT